MTQPNHSHRCLPLALLTAILALACSSTASAEQVLESASVARIVEGDTVVIRYAAPGGRGRGPGGAARPLAGERSDAALGVAAPLSIEATKAR